MAKLVQFSDGTYGVRVGWFFGWLFRDLRNPGFTWSCGSQFFHDCKGTREDAARYVSKHRVVNEATP